MRNFGLGKPAGGGVGARVGSDRSPYDEQKFLEIRTPLCLGDGQPPHVCDRYWLDWDLGLNEIIRALPDTRNKAIAPDKTYSIFCVGNRQKHSHLVITT